jgi:hypothetical protein
MENERVNEEKEAELYRQGREFRGGYDGMSWEGDVVQSLPFETTLFRGFHYIRKTRGYHGANSETEIGLAYWPTTEDGEKLDLTIARDLPLEFGEKNRVHLTVVNSRSVKIGLSKKDVETPEVEKEIPLKTLDEKVQIFKERNGKDPDEYTICTILRDTPAYQE